MTSPHQRFKKKTLHVWKPCFCLPLKSCSHFFSTCLMPISKFTKPYYHLAKESKKTHQLIYIYIYIYIRRLCKIISILKNHQPHCPQLYLYSRADKVIPFQSLESFIKYQKGAGKKVQFFDFGSSPHVDHYRTFPDIYSLHLNKFLDESLIAERKLYQD